MKNIKILVSCHKEVELFKSDLIVPIQVGCDLNEKRFKGMLRDNDGENISIKNQLRVEIDHCQVCVRYSSHGRRLHRRSGSLSGLVLLQAEERKSTCDEGPQTAVKGVQKILTASGNPY